MFFFNKGQGPSEKLFSVVLKVESVLVTLYSRCYLMITLRTFCLNMIMLLNSKGGLEVTGLGWCSPFCQ